MKRTRTNAVVLTLWLNAALWAALFTMSVRNSRATNAPVLEILEAWAPTLWCPMIATVTAMLVRALPIPRRALAGVALVTFAVAVYGLTASFDTGDGVCTHQLTTLTGTVRGDCFEQPKLIAAALWSAAATALALLFATPTRLPRSS